MSLFQKSVEKKYLNELDSALIDAKYSAFSAYFGNKLIQQNIKSAKEEQFQEGFLRELFVKILGYTLQPEPDYNLISEYKNITNSRKADGAILRAGEALAVIELKSLSTTDLDTIESQAFGYKNHHPKCIYVITSNFGKLRFYIQNAVDYIDFDLFNLSRNQFCLLWLCLAKDNLLNDVPLKIKESSILQEENITKKLYADYSKFRNAIYNNLVKNNPELDKLLLFKKTQKLLDRFLFVFFAEDRLLLPPNSIREIINHWETLRDVLDEYVPLYDRFKKYFGYLNTGFKNKNMEIFAYNGGLFADDEILDNITIDDEILYHHTLKLSQYDFDTEVDVNILGHIFEHSLGEIENVQAEIKGEKVESQKSKRKKDGIYYTPKYITKYIVENTVGKLCAEKRVQFGINPEDYAIERTKKDKDIIIALDEKLSHYRNWLLTITILDPACGSGAFLNQALEFLIEEHRKLDELRALLFGGGLVFADITTDILENNIFGVDINEESVEIAKLSLWLRTAQKGRKLNTLTSNIKCGNSLIDDPRVADEKAFNWAVEFPQVFGDGGSGLEVRGSEYGTNPQHLTPNPKKGFDVVIGNPPWGAKLAKNEIESIINSFPEISSCELDTYIVFMIKGLNILKSNGCLGYIVPDTWLSLQRTHNLRKYIYDNSQIIDIYDRYKPFEDAKDTRSHSIILTKNTDIKDEYNFTVKISDSKFKVIKDYILSSELLQNFKEWNLYKSNDENDIFQKMIDKSKQLKELYNIKYGLRTGDNKKYLSNIDVNGLGLKIARGSHIQRYYFNWTEEYLISKDGLPSSYFEPNNLKEKIILQYVRTNSTDIKSKWLEATIIDEINFVPLNSTSYIYGNSFSSLKYLLTILSSYLMNYYYKAHYTDVNVKPIYLEKLPIPNISPEAQLPFIELADIMLEKNKELQYVKNKFLDLLKADFSIEKLSTKLQNWYELSWADFTAELRKLKIELKGIHKEDWSERHSRMTSQAQEIKTIITQTDRTIDRLVYQLYELTEDEVKVVEGE